MFGEGRWGRATVKANPFENENGELLVLVNDERQHSLWPANLDILAGWTASGPAGACGVCLARIEQHWTDRSPRRLASDERRRSSTQSPPVSHVEVWPLVEAVTRRLVSARVRRARRGRWRSSDSPATQFPPGVSSRVGRGRLPSHFRLFRPTGRRAAPPGQSPCGCPEPCPRDAAAAVRSRRAFQGSWPALGPSTAKVMSTSVLRA